MMYGMIAPAGRAKNFVLNLADETGNEVTMKDGVAVVEKMVSS